MITNVLKNVYLIGNLIGFLKFILILIRKFERSDSQCRTIERNGLVVGRYVVATVFRVTGIVVTSEALFLFCTLMTP